MTEKTYVFLWGVLSGAILMYFLVLFTLIIKSMIFWCNR